MVSLADLVPRNRPIVYGILMPGYGFPNGVPVIKVKDIVNDEINQGDLLLTDPKIDEAYRRSRVRSGDLLFTIRGSVGRMAFVPTNLEGANITQDTARISISEANPRFIRYFLDMSFVKAFIELHTLGQAVRGINLEMVRKIPIACPPLDEQSRIDDILTCMSLNINANRECHTKLQRLKTGLMQDLLTGRVSVEPLLATTGSQGD